MRKSQGIMVVLVLVLVALLSSCSTLTAGKSNDNGTAIPIKEKAVEVLGSVKVEYSAFGALGISPRVSLFSWGTESSYVALLEEAKKMGADEVINIKTDLITSNTYIFYNTSKWVATGLAVKYLD
ncbi:DUF6567 family protein [Sphaerochaeta sp.]|uniref:DUF6567 family protein n=1 Tax=Sphaerochaeta sp. TaxID=1972642 RepID=UPI002AA71C98|nr:DUF6567 family protein [uncultured Sphaerochaeta sp.]